jgi:hypothetical protein
MTSTECFKCPVCLNSNVPLSKGTKTVCGHLYCSLCINKWVVAQQIPTCPLCRQTIC